MFFLNRVGGFAIEAIVSEIFLTCLEAEAAAAAAANLLIDKRKTIGTKLADFWKCYFEQSTWRRVSQRGHFGPVLLKLEWAKP